MEKIKGKFFLPENHKKKRKQIDGTIEIEDNGLAHLDLSGVLTDDHPFLLLENRQKITIWGIAENGSEISLLDCFNIKVTQHLGPNGMSIEKYRIKFVLKNAWVENTESNYFNKLSVQIEGLDQWLNISGGKRNVSFDNSNAEIFSYTYKLPEPINFDLEDGLKGSFYFSLKDENVRFGCELQQRTCLELQTEKPANLSYFLEKLYHFTKFLNILSDSALDFEFVIMTSFKKVSIILNNQTYYEDLNLILLRENLSSQKINRDRHSFIVNYDSVKESFEGIIKKWFQLKSDSIQRIIDIMYECIENKNKVKINLFLAISQAVEGVYRITKNQRNHSFEKTIRTILIENIDKIHLQDGPNINKDIDELTKFIKELRNDLTHIGKFKKQEIKQSEIYFYTNLLRNVLSVVLLKNIGIEGKLIRIIQ